MREGDFDSGCAELFDDSGVELMSCGDDVFEVWEEGSEFEVECAVAETCEEDGGGGSSEYAGVFGCDFSEEFGDFFGVFAVGDADVDCDAQDGV